MGILSSVAGGILGGGNGGGGFISNPLVSGLLGAQILNGIGGATTYDAGGKPTLDLSSPEYLQKLREQELKAIQGLLAQGQQNAVDLLNYASATESNTLTPMAQLRSSIYETIG